MMRSRLVTWIGACLAIGCGGASLHPETATHEIAITTEERALAPDLASRVDQANQAAHDAAIAGDHEAQRDHAEAARLWHVALHAEAERTTAARAQQAVLREIEEIDAARLADDAARVAIEQTIRRQKAAAIARAEAARVLSEAEIDETRRRGGDPARMQSRREAARVLLDRSVAIVAAATALGADATLTDAATQAVDAARAKLDGSPTSMKTAQHAFALSQAALGRARAQRPGPSVEEHASLFEALAALGVTAEASDDGVVIWIADAFASGRAELKPAGKALLDSLGAVLTSHPHGPVQAHALASAAFPRATLRRRIQNLQTTLRLTLSDRVTTIDASGGSDHDNMIRIVLPAYTCGALPTATACTSRPSATNTPPAAR